MKRLILSFLLVGAFNSSFALNTSDSTRIATAEKSIIENKRIIEEARRNIVAAQTSIELLNAELLKSNHAVDSLKNVTSINTENIAQTAEKLGIQIKATDENLQSKADSSALKSNSLIGAGLIALVILIVLVLYYILHSRINKGTVSIEQLKKKAEDLNEEIVNKFSLEMSEIKKLATSLGSIVSSTPKDAEPDHSLIKLLADRITFMEMTLFKMDPKVRGYRQLSSSISQMKDNLTANGYEIVDMLGKPYNDGMKVTANFIEDEDIEEGKQIITGIIKPQINYKGIMIQSAQITVSQNI